MSKVAPLFRNLNEEDSVHESLDSEPVTSSLADLDSMGLVDLTTLGDSVLAGTLRTILIEVAGSEEAVAGFNSAL